MRTVMKMMMMASGVDLMTEYSMYVNITMKFEI